MLLLLSLLLLYAVSPAHKREQVILSPSTAVSFMYAKYRVVIAVDVSPSMFVMNPDGSLPFDVAMASLETVGVLAPIGWG
jgi:hypothetical protein